MDQLVDRAGGLLGQLAALPAATADDLLLKMFPFFLELFEPKNGDAPMLPTFDDTGNVRHSLFEAVQSERAGRADPPEGDDHDASCK